MWHFSSFHAIKNRNFGEIRAERNISSTAKALHAVIFIVLCDFFNY